MRYFKSPLMLVAAVAGLLLSGCLKDTETRTYTIYEPVYSTSAEVRANIKSSAPKNIERPGKIYVYKNYLFVNEINKGIHVIENYDKNSAQKIAYLPVPGNVDMAVVNNVLYADSYTDLMAIDISDIHNIKLSSHLSNMFPDRYYVQGKQADDIIVDWKKRDTTVNGENYALWRAGQIIFDAFFNTANSTGGSKTGTGGSMARFTAIKNTLYTVTNNRLNVINVSQPLTPKFSNNVGLGFGIETIYPFKDKLFIGSNTGMLIYDVSSPSAPAKLGEFQHARVCDPVIANDSLAYVTLRNGSQCAGFINELNVVNVTDPTNSKLVSKYDMTNPHGLSQDGKWLFVCDGKDGLKVLDVSNSQKISTFKKIDIPDAFDVICYGKTAIVSATSGTYIYNYEDINNIKFVNKF